MIQSADDWQRLQELFAAASALPPDQRVLYLDAECPTGELRSQLEAMLEADDNSQWIHPTVGAPPLAEQGEEPVSTIGPYRLGEIIGQGGMGIVYRAEQTRPFRRRVALKVVRPGQDNANILARFDSERQALALMDHPAIAKIYDAGTTDDQRPYFAMEYVPGLPITEYCDREKLSTRERLELFAEVCEGVQHAHQKGIIHRDLKPSNVLVTSDGTRHRPKIIDFGIAKATGFQLTEQTLFTHHGQMIGTPEYMSPEQADPTSIDIDTRTDVYSLGVLLYVLLVDEHPYSHDLAENRDLLHIRKVILESQAPRPSTRLDDATEQTADLVTRRSTDLGGLRRELRGDLDWIALKALDKDRNRRYASASELTTDVRRHLASEPIVARPPSVIYLLRKAAWRHRHVLIPVVLVLIALLGSLSVATYRYVYVRAIAEHAGDLRTVETLEARDDALWPESPETAPAMREWLDEARPIAATLPALEEELLQLRSRGVAGDAPRIESAQEKWLHQHREDLRRRRDRLPRGAEDPTSRARVERIEREIAAIDARLGTERSWNFTDVEEQLYHDVLTGLVARLRPLVRDRIPDVESRLRVAESIAAQSIESPAMIARWSRAIEDIRTSPRYGGLELVPQLGLVPLRRDPQSDLWEFWHVRTGEEPALRSQTDDWRMTDETGMIFVLIPGGSFTMGAEPPVIAFTGDAAVVAEAVVAQEQGGMTLASRIGLRTGDRILSIMGQPVDSATASDRIATWRTGMLVSMAIERDGESQQLEITVPGNIDPHGHFNERPVHTVELEPFFLAKFEMTQGQWLRFTGSNPSNYNAEDREYVELAHPVERVSWYDAHAQLGRLALRLPSEEEWEYAARAGTTTIWWTGNDERSIEGTTNLWDQSGKRRANVSSPYLEWLDDGHFVHAPVGCFRPNAFGLYDTIGNISEWTNQTAGNYQQEILPKNEPYAIKRGGSFFDPAPTQCRSAARFFVTKTDRDFGLGVRPARSIER